MEQLAINNVVEYVITGITVIITVLSLIGASKSGVWPFELEIASDDEETQRVRTSIEQSVSGNSEVPFEVEQLTNYYSQVLTQSKISFWFSLVFASLGFVAIVLAAFMYTSESSGSTIAQFVAGTIMEAVASLFFVQSKNSQKSMGDFFDKLRNDRLHHESRKLCDDIQDKGAQDALKLHLALHYAGVPNAESTAKHISETLLGDKP
ncbi:TPA: hypothetical protein ACPJ2V_004567 [Vibrio diabolicus]